MATTGPRPWPEPGYHSLASTTVRPTAVRDKYECNFVHKIGTTTRLELPGRSSESDLLEATTRCLPAVLLLPEGFETSTLAVLRRTCGKAALLTDSRVRARRSLHETGRNSPSALSSRAIETSPEFESSPGGGGRKLMLILLGV